MGGSEIAEGRLRICGRAFDELPAFVRAAEMIAVRTVRAPTPPLAQLTTGGNELARSGKLDRAPSRLYRGQFLQENMRLKALAEIYTMHSFALL